MSDRHLSAILHADVVGYSELTATDEEKTLKALKESLELFSSMIAEFGGKKINEAGDALLAEFASVTAAVECGVGFQQKMFAANEQDVYGLDFQYRIGIHLGEVNRRDNDIYGEGVNIAARLQGLADPSGVCVSGSVYDQVGGHSQYTFVDLGYQALKNIPNPVRVYAIGGAGHEVQRSEVLFGDAQAETTHLLTGGCLCGDIRYEAEGKDLGSAYCHCRMCQRFTGAPATVGTGIKKHLFRITQGQPKSYTSSKIATRTFCPNCGSSLWMSWPNIEGRLDWIFIHTASLDNPNLVSPNSHTGIESQLKWHDIHDDLPRGRCEDSPQIAEAWESAGVKITDYPRNVNLE